MILLEVLQNGMYSNMLIKKSMKAAFHKNEIQCYE